MIWKGRDEGNGDNGEPGNETQSYRCVDQESPSDQVDGTGHVLKAVTHMWYLFRNQRQIGIIKPLNGKCNAN